MVIEWISAVVFYAWALDEGCRLASGVGLKVWTLCSLYVGLGSALVCFGLV